jgi:hypothetical protein
MIRAHYAVICGVLETPTTTQNCTMLIPILIALNLPLYLLFGWILFDDAETPAKSFGEAIGRVLKAMLFALGRLLVSGRSAPDEGGQGFKALCFCVGCIAVTAGEWYLLTTYVWPEG